MIIRYLISFTSIPMSKLIYQPKYTFKQWRVSILVYFSDVLIWLRLTAAILRCIHRIESCYFSLCLNENHLLLLRLNLASKRIRKTRCWFYSTFLSLLYYAWVGRWWLWFSLLVKVWIIIWCHCVLKRIERKSSMNSPCWNIGIGIVSILRSVIDDLHLFFIHQVKRVLELCSCNKISWYLWFSWLLKSKL